CKEFAKLLGGWITLQSTEGQGSSFTLTIPSLPNGIEEEHCQKLAMNEVAVTTVEEEQIKEQPVAMEEALQHEVEVFQGKNILIVDDDNRNIYALKTALEKRGMHILVAKDGLECLEVLQANPDIDLVLMDIMMPNMDGYEAMTIIRQQMKRIDLPIIALTAKAMKNDRDK
ncbi:response regulator, partial [Clostridioides difficile]|nr:response regulator [Clostridioides difficile]